MEKQKKETAPCKGSLLRSVYDLIFSFSSSLSPFRNNCSLISLVYLISVV